MAGMFTDNRYEVVLANQHFLRELVESVTMEDSLGEIAYRALIKLVATPDFQKIGIMPGQEIRVSGVPFGGNSMAYLLHPGMVWECRSENKGQKHIDVTVYDRTIYLSKSEDEYLLPEGQTATQRLQQYASDWGIKLADVADTGISLAKAVYRARPIYSMIMGDLKQTASKGGKMYRPRMSPDGLQLAELGSNETVWALEADRNVEDIVQRRTLEGTITQVKVLGNASRDERSPVLALVSGEVETYGTLQKVHSDNKITDTGAAKEAGKNLLCGVQETITVTGLDINTIRAGDKIQLNGLELLAISVKHELGSPGRMTLELGDETYVRRRYYNDTV